MSYRQMTKPLVHKVEQMWGYTCCIGSVVPSARSLNWATRNGADNVMWTAAMREATAHSHVWHAVERRAQTTDCAQRNERSPW